MKTRQKDRLRKLLTAALASGVLKPELADSAAEYLVTGALRDTAPCPREAESPLGYAVWLALAWSTVLVYDPARVEDSLYALHKALKAEGITI